MKAFLYGTMVQWKLDIRDKGILVAYYIVPLVFFLFMGGIFTSIIPDAYKTIIQSMTVFAATMGAIIGSPSPLVEFYRSNVKKSYHIGGVPLWTVTVSNFISALVHLTITSCIILLIAPMIFEAIIPNNLWIYFVSLTLTIVASVSVGTLLGLFVKNNSKLTMISQFIFLPSIMLSGIMFPVDMLPEPLQYIGNIFPATWGYKLMCSDALSLENILPLFVIIIVTLTVSAIKLSKMKSE